jgi:hypothetical protein
LAVDLVVAGAAVHGVVAVAGVHGVGARPREDQVAAVHGGAATAGAGPVVDHVVAAEAEQDVVLGRAGERVRPPVPRMGRPNAGQCHAAAAAGSGQ